MQLYLRLPTLDGSVDANNLSTFLVSLALQIKIITSATSPIIIPTYSVTSCLIAGLRPVISNVNFLTDFISVMVDDGSPATVPVGTKSGLALWIPLPERSFWLDCLFHCVILQTWMLHLCKLASMPAALCDLMQLGSHKYDHNQH